MEGDTSGELGVVLAGELNIVVDQKKVATLGPGELVGEGVAFIPQSYRMATVESGGVALVAVLAKEALRSLRQEHGPVYDALLADAVRVVARRQDTDKRVARLSTGGATVPTKNPSAVKKLWQTLKVWR